MLLPLTTCLHSVWPSIWHLTRSSPGHRLKDADRLRVAAEPCLDGRMHSGNFVSSEIVGNDDAELRRDDFETTPHEPLTMERGHNK